MVESGARKSTLLVDSGHETIATAIGRNSIVADLRRALPVNPFGKSVWKQ